MKSARIVACPTFQLSRYNFRMIHRVVCLILIALLPVNQAAICCAHTHEGQDDSTPHVHLPWTSHGSHSHGHHHAHGHHHHGHHHHGSDSHSHQSTDHDQSQHDAELKRDTESSLGHHEEAVVFCTEANILNTACSIDLDDSDHVAIDCAFESRPVKDCFDRASFKLQDTAARAQCAILLQTCCLRI